MVFRAQKRHINSGAIHGAPVPVDKDRAIPEPGSVSFFTLTLRQIHACGWGQPHPGEKSPTGHAGERGFTPPGRSTTSKLHGEKTHGVDEG